MTGPAVLSRRSIVAERSRDAHRLCAALADLLAEAIRAGDEEAAARYKEDLERIERVALEPTKGLSAWRNSDD